MRKILLATTAMAFAVSGAVPAFAEFNDRTIRVSNGINADHPVGNGIDAIQLAPICDALDQIYFLNFTEPI